MGPQIKNPQLPHLRNLINIEARNLRFAICEYYVKDHPPLVNIRTGKKSNKQEGKVKIRKGYKQSIRELREST
jgi:hypothetical protein